MVQIDRYDFEALLNLRLAPPSWTDRADREPGEHSSSRSPGRRSVRRPGQLQRAASSAHRREIRTSSQVFEGRSHDVVSRHGPGRRDARSLGAVPRRRRPEVVEVASDIVAAVGGRTSAPDVPVGVVHRSFVLRMGITCSGKPRPLVGVARRDRVITDWRTADTLDDRCTSVCGASGAGFRVTSSSRSTSYDRTLTPQRKITGFDFVDQMIHIGDSLIEHVHIISRSKTPPNSRSATSSQLLNFGTQAPIRAPSSNRSISGKVAVVADQHQVSVAAQLVEHALDRDVRPPSGRPLPTAGSAGHRCSSVPGSLIGSSSLTANGLDRLPARSTPRRSQDSQRTVGTRPRPRSAPAAFHVDVLTVSGVGWYRSEFPGIDWLAAAGLVQVGP